MSTVIYTAIAGSGRDILRDPEPVDGVDYVCFTDQPLKSNIWNIRPFEFNDESNVIKAKHPKILPHLYFNDYDISIWVDGNILPKNGIVAICNSVLNHYEMALHVHPRRNCIYCEIDHLLNKNSVYSGMLKKQRDEYDVPVNNGLWECGVLFRKHNDEKVIKTMELWWSEIIKRRQPRDQVSFAYSIWKTALPILNIHGDLRKKEYVNYVKHNVAKQIFFKCSERAKKERIQSIINRQKHKRVLSEKYA